MKATRIPVLITLQAVATTLGACSLGCSAYAFQYDRQWNEKVEESQANLNEQTLDALIRSSKDEKAFIGIVCILWFGSLTNLFIYLFCYRNTSVWSTFNTITNGAAGLLLTIYGWLYMSSTIRINNSYKTIYNDDHHHEYTDYFFCDVRNFRHFLDLNADQQAILEAEKVCQRWGYKYTAAVREITFFWVVHNFYHAAALVNSVIYAIIAWMEYWLQNRAATKLDEQHRESMVSGTTPTNTPAVDGLRETGLDD